MSKFLEVTEQGFVWHVPAERIAHNRAEYYKEDGYEAEFKYTMESNYELSDWFSSNMNWEDVKDVAVLVKKPSMPEPQMGESEVEVIEKEAVHVDDGTGSDMWPEVNPK